jgi:hypothetical protein
MVGAMGQLTLQIENILIREIITLTPVGAQMIIDCI